MDEKLKFLEYLLFINLHVQQMHSVNCKQPHDIHDVFFYHGFLKIILTLYNCHHRNIVRGFMLQEIIK